MNEPGAPGAVVVGTGRCGTGYTAALLQANGLRAGHEEWFRPFPNEQRTTGLDVDVSWLALPDIEKGRWSGPVAHIVRHPVSVVRSLMGIYFFHPMACGVCNPFISFARSNCPEVEGLYHEQAAVEWWVAWNRRCQAAAGGEQPHRVEDLHTLGGATYLGTALGLSLEAKPVPTNTNSRERFNISEDRILTLLDGREEQFGYYGGLP